MKLQRVRKIVEHLGIEKHNSKLNYSVPEESVYLTLPGASRQKLGFLNIKRMALDEVGNIRIQAEGPCRSPRIRNGIFLNVKVKLVLRY